MRKMFFFILLCSLAACNLPKPEHAAGGDAETTITPAIESDSTICGWNWATRELPDLGSEVQAAMESAGLTGVNVLAEAYGENCITASGTVDHFAAMETDFHISVETADLTDSTTMGELLEQVLIVLDAYPPGTTPGPQPGYIGVRFFHGSGEINLWFTFTEGQSAREQGLHGADLFLGFTDR